MLCSRRVQSVYDASSVLSCPLGHHAETPNGLRSMPPIGFAVAVRKIVPRLGPWALARDQQTTTSIISFVGERQVSSRISLAGAGDLASSMMAFVELQPVRYPPETLSPQASARAASQASKTPCRAMAIDLAAGVIPSKLLRHPITGYQVSRRNFSVMGRSTMQSFTTSTGLLR